MVPSKKITLTKRQRLEIKNFLDRSNDDLGPRLLFANVCGDVDKASLTVYYLEKDYALKLKGFAEKLHEEMMQDRECYAKMQEMI